jgi:ABC-2 type transport system ATP-binding protein
MAVLELDGVSKRFGPRPVLRELALSIPEHTVFGLIGKNGAGKTTTMKMILGFLRPDEGEIRVCGERVRYGNTRTNRYVGYLPDVPEFYGYMRPLEYLAFCGSISGMPRGRIRERARELLALVGLEGESRKIKGFSRGMKQRLGIAQALLGSPALLICDEPTSALDPVGRKEILEILAVAGKQTSILFSTHILSDVERVCDRIAILNGGRIALQGPLEEVRGHFGTDAVAVHLADNSAGALQAYCGSLPFVRSADCSGNTVTLRVSDVRKDGPRLLGLLAEKRLPIVKYEVLEPTLEDVFLEVIG